MPYPGLRSFQRDETDLFFGREGTVNEMLRRLARTRFLAVLGASGSGKSSLVRTGMLDGLELGLIAEAGSWWRVIDVRPGGAPMRALARALAGEGAGEDEVEQLRAFLLRGPRALIEWAGGGRLAEGENLLVLVDQFEELFRYQSYKDHQEAEAFIALLLESARTRDLPIHVTLTMRSEYLGACALFTGLAEAMNDGQFLTPRMTREQCRRAIEGPARVCGFEIEPALVSRMLNDLGNFAPWDDRGDADLRSQLDLIGRRADQLPLLQHALNRLWLQATARGDAPVLRLEDYQAFGGLRGTIDHHAREMVAALPPQQRAVVPALFRALTAGSGLADAVRRPTLFGELVRIAGAAEADVRAVVEAFRARGCNFLMPPPQVPLTDATIIDISHESLIRQWEDLARWLADEATDAAQIRRLDDAAERNATGQGELLSGRDLAVLADWRRGARPTEAWARRYVADPGRAFRFLDESTDAARRARARKRLVPGLLVALALVAMISAGFGLLRQSQNRQLADEKAATEKLNLELGRSAEEIRRVNAELTEAQAREKSAAEKAQKDLAELIATTSGFVAELVAGRQQSGALEDAADILAGFVPSIATVDDLPDGFVNLYALQHVIDVSVRLPPLQAGAVRPVGAAVSDPEILSENAADAAPPSPLQLVAATGNDDQLFLVDLRSGQTLAAIFHDSFSHGAVERAFVAPDGGQIILQLGNGRLMRWETGAPATRRVMDTRWLYEKPDGARLPQDRMVEGVVFDGKEDLVAVSYRQFETRFLTVLGPDKAAEARSWSFHDIAAILEPVLHGPETGNMLWAEDLMPVTLHDSRVIIRDGLSGALFAFDPQIEAGELILPSYASHAVLPTADPDTVLLLTDVAAPACAGTADPLAVAIAIQNLDFAQCLVMFDLAARAVRGQRLALPDERLFGPADVLTVVTVEASDWGSALLAGAVATLDLESGALAVFGGLDPLAAPPRFRISIMPDAERKLPADGPATLEGWLSLDGLNSAISWQGSEFMSGAPRLAVHDLDAGFAVTNVQSSETPLIDLDVPVDTGIAPAEGMPSILHFDPVSAAGATGKAVTAVSITLQSPANATGTVVAPSGNLALISTMEGLFLQRLSVADHPALATVQGVMPVCAPGEHGAAGPAEAGPGEAGPGSAGPAPAEAARKATALPQLLPFAALGSGGRHFLVYSPAREQSYVLTLMPGQDGDQVGARLGCLAMGGRVPVAVDQESGRALLPGTTADDLLLWQPPDAPDLDAVPARLSIKDEEGARAAAFLDDGGLVVLTGKGNLAWFPPQPATAQGAVQKVAPARVVAAFLPDAEGIVVRDGTIALYRSEATLGAGGLTVLMARIDGETGLAVVQSGGMLPIFGARPIALRIADPAGRVDVLTFSGGLLRFALAPVPDAGTLLAALSASGNAARLRQSGTLGTDAGIAALLADTIRGARDPAPAKDAVICGAGIEAIYAGWRSNPEQTVALNSQFPAACETLGAGAMVPDTIGALANALRNTTAAERKAWPAEWSALLAAADAGDPMALRGLLMAILTVPPQADTGAPGAFAAWELSEAVFGAPDPASPDPAPAPQAAPLLAPGQDMPDAGVQRALGLLAEARGDAATAYRHFVRAELVLREAGEDAEADRVAARRVAVALALPADMRAREAAAFAAWEPDVPGPAAPMAKPDLAADLAALARLGAALDEPGAAAMLGIDRLSLGLVAEDAETRRQAALAIAEIATSVPSWPEFAASGGGLAPVLGRALEVLGEADSGPRLRLALAVVSLVENDGAPVDFSFPPATAEYRQALAIAVAATGADLAAAAPLLRFNSAAFGYNVRISDPEPSAALRAILADRLRLCSALPEAAGAAAACATTPFWQTIHTYEISDEFSLATPEDRQAAAQAYPQLLAHSFHLLRDVYNQGGAVADEIFGTYVSAASWAASSQLVLRQAGLEPPAMTYLEAMEAMAELLRRAETGAPIAPRDAPVSDVMQYLDRVIFDVAQPTLPEPPFVEEDIPALRLALDGLVYGHEWEKINQMGGWTQNDDLNVARAGLVWFPSYAIAYAAGRQRNRMGAEAQMSPLGQDCARRATSYLDPDRVAPGVAFFSVAEDLGVVSVCQAAYDEAWQAKGGVADPALAYLLGRALSAEAERNGMASEMSSPFIGYFAESARAGYAAAFNNLDAQLDWSGAAPLSRPGVGYRERVLLSSFADAYYAFQALDLTDRDRAALLHFAKQAGDLGSIEANRIAAILDPDPVERWLRLSIAAQLMRQTGDFAGVSAATAEAATISLSYGQDVLARARLAAWRTRELTGLPDDLAALFPPLPSAPE
jgi:hypothetical protein